MAFLAIMNPIANAAVFVGLTSNMNKSLRNRVAIRALLTSFAIIFAFCVLGKSMFHVFGITLPALRIAGGFLVFMVGYQMMHGEQSKVHQPHDSELSTEDQNALDLAISPLAIPILAGPGTIATAMSFSANGCLEAVSITAAAFAVLCVITLFCFIYS